MNIYIGCHISIKKGFLGAANTARQLGAQAFQYFPKNPRSLALKKIDAHDTHACSIYSEAHQLKSIAHAPYPTNLAVQDPSLREATIQSILNDLEIVNRCGSIGLVVHFGKYKGSDRLLGYRNIISLLNEVLQQWEGDALLLIENQAGEGSSFGTTLEELVQIRNLTIKPDKVGFCLDTCHAFASGLWTGDNLESLLVKGEQLGYFQQLKAVHLNDSMYPSGSLRDRHMGIGQGYIGEARFRQFLNIKWLRDVPIILETPTASHQEEIVYVQSIASS